VCAVLEREFVASRYATTLFLLGVALVPWTWFPPFPWLHQHAQWADVAFACSAALWVVERVRKRVSPLPLHAPSVLAALYFVCAAGSTLAHRAEGTMPWKLLGIGELCVLLIITADLTRSPFVAKWFGHVIAVNAIVIGVLAIVGLALYREGINTHLVGSYGAYLVPSPRYARMQAGMYHPNLLGSYTVFGAAIVAAPRSRLAPWLRRAASAALWVAIVLSISRAAIGFALAAFVRSALRRGDRVGRAMAAGASILAVLAMAVMTRWNVTVDPSRWEMRFVEPTAEGRLLLILPSLRTVAENPLWGCGPDCAPALLGGDAWDTHLTWVNIAATLGVPALGAFVGIVVSAWRGRARPTEVALWSGVAGIFVDSLASDVEDFRHVWMLLGLSARAGSPDPPRPSAPCGLRGVAESGTPSTS
jgi:hypothetical protein